jgi:tripartite-type tricarboxylate transporter receptor subunit TctC
MKLPRRQFLRLAATAVALPTLAPTARAQAYPSRPVILVVPYGAGGPSDTIGRILAEGMRAALVKPLSLKTRLVLPAQSASVAWRARRPMATRLSWAAGLLTFSTASIRRAKGFRARFADFQRTSPNRC